jgi:hypothetical protein
VPINCGTRVKFCQRVDLVGLIGIAVENDEEHFGLQVDPFGCTGKNRQRDARGSTSICDEVLGGGPRSSEDDGSKNCP